MNGKSKAKTPAEYLASLEGPRKKDVVAVHKLIRATAPKLKPFMIAGMVGYGPYHYKYASGREGDWCLIGLASQKQYISLYVCAVENGRYIAEEYKKALPAADIGKSCVRFKKLEDVDLKVVARMVKHAARLAQ